MGVGEIRLRSVSGGGATQAIISGLIPSTTYSIEVAAVNSAGIGVYSPAIDETPESKYCCAVPLHGGKR